MNPGPSSGEHTQQELVFIESQRGGKSLLHDGYRYNLNKTNKDSTTLWRCVNRADCSASIKLGPQRNNVRTPPTPHSCRRNKFRNEVDLIIDSCKKEVCKNYAPVKQIFEEQITKLNLHEKSGKQFFGDSTFKRVPKPFKQLFTLQLDIGSNENHTNIVPVVYALLPDKTKRTYIRLFEALKRIRTLKRELSLDIDFFKCDYEVGQYKAFRMVFPQAKLTGCYFHFNKNVWDKGEEMNLTSTKEGRHAVRLTANLPLIPTACIADAWINIIQITPDTDEMRDFHCAASFHATTRIRVLGITFRHRQDANSRLRH
ncbi:uncharacterized protein LOC133522565 [Cydia pomonella]|uniref:uncharacterized protein LOC133522565 n=1 Tax=Cydia pomonella TaxID=82600 RepID=UPI002ADDBE82|nr:uncharacterized protein LOC133522565 [Cydia pomonella]